MLLLLSKVSLRKENSKAKKPKKIKMSIDVLKNLQINANIQLVRTCVLARWLEHDRRKRRLPDRLATYLTDLGKRIEKEGLKQPIILAVSKITERAYIYDRNHRMAVLLNEGVPWVPLKGNLFK